MSVFSELQAKDSHHRLLRGKRVLVVDDFAAARELLRYVLEATGATVDEAESADEALAQLRENPPDLLISDISMPGRDGFWLVREMRTAVKLETLPAVALSALPSSPAQLDRAHEAGFDLYVSKPFDTNGLLVSLAKLLGPSA